MPKIPFPRVLFVLLVCALFSACGTKVSTTAPAPVVIVDAALLPLSTLMALRASPLPQGYPLIVQTVQALPASIQVASEADELFEKAIDRCVDRSRCKSHGVFILLSGHPRLIQLRVGRDIAMLARARGITAGPAHTELQKSVLSGSMPLHLGLDELLSRLERELEKKTEQVWYERWILANLPTVVYFELDQLGSPSESLYSKWFIRGLTALFVWSGTTMHTILPAIAAAAVLAHLGKLLWASTCARLGTIGPRMAIAAIYLTALGRIGLDTLYAITAAIVAILVSGGTIEDRLALGYWGIPNLAAYSFSPNAWAESTTFYFALLIVAVRIASEVIKDSQHLLFANFRDDTQRALYDAVTANSAHRKFWLEAVGTRGAAISQQEFATSPFTHLAIATLQLSFKHGLSWGLLAWLFLPKVLSITLLMLWTVSFVLDLAPAIRQVPEFLRLRQMERAKRQSRATHDHGRP